MHIAVGLGPVILDTGHPQIDEVDIVNVCVSYILMYTYMYMCGHTFVLMAILDIL